MLPTGTVTFLFTDIEGSTALWQAHPELMKANLARHDELLRTAIEGHGGSVFKAMGDAFCAAFPTALQGIQAAMDAQQALADENWGECVLRVRMGLHTGDSEARGNDYFGTTLNRTARLMSAGHGGQTLISQATQELVCENLPQQAVLRDLGRHRLKDLINPEHIFQLDVAGLPSEFPALRTLDVQLHNLPSQLTPFVGREREIKAVMGLMRNEAVRLVTLTGAGGTGKTRLSLQVAAELLDEFEHGTWFVELASITDPGLFLPTIAATLRVRESAGKPIEQALDEHLQDKHLLLVLDNFEQIVSASPQISGLLARAPRVKVLVSSREVLHLRGEHDYPVLPLGLPERRRKQTAAVLLQYEAIALFVQHARAASPSFALDEENASIVAEICMRLDGLPLAIELAAARSRMLRPAAMLEKLTKRLDVLVSRSRDVPHRQQTIRAAIDWSYDLLDDTEKKLFARLGIFVGGWTEAAAEAVAGPGLQAQVLSGLESLLDKSLIRRAEASGGETRFTMLETIREYAHEKLAASGELPAVQQAHADAMEQLLREIISRQSGPDEAAWFARLDDDFDNLRSVMEWALAQRKPSYVLSLGRIWQYWYQRAKLQEPLAWLRSALAMEGGSALERAHALNCAGNIAAESASYQDARADYEAALVLWRELDDANGIAKEISNLANIVWQNDRDYERARQLFEEVLVIGRDPNSFNHAMVLNNLGSLARIRGDHAAALEYFTRSREMCVAVGSEAGVSYADWFLGRLALSLRKLNEAGVHFESQQKASWLKANPLLYRWAESYKGYIRLLRGQVEEARRILDDALEAALEYYLQTPNLSDGWLLMDAKARLALLDGRFERSAQLFGAAWAQRERDEALLTEFERPEYEARISELRAALGDSAFDAAFQKGQAMQLLPALVLAAGTEPGWSGGRAGDAAL